jgi:hypothetical protein
LVLITCTEAGVRSTISELRLAVTIISFSVVVDLFNAISSSVFLSLVISSDFITVSYPVPSATKVYFPEAGL